MQASFSVNISVEEKGRKRPEYTLDSDLAGEVTLLDFLEFTRATLIITADEVLRDAQQEGFDKEPILLVDGRRGKAVQNVNPLGQIEFVARVQDFTEVLQATYEGLFERSKILTGRYISSHYFFYNGQQKATDVTSLLNWLKTEPEFKDGDVFRFVNIQPYARKLERYGVTAQRSSPKVGKGSRKGGSKQVLLPNGVYQLTERSIKAKYKQNALIRFSFIPGTSIGLSATFKSGRKGKNSAGRSYLYPSIEIKFQQRGVV